MRMDALISCALCLRATRDWRNVELSSGGVKVWSGQCCRACATEVETTVARLVRETRAHAVMGGAA